MKQQELKEFLDEKVLLYNDPGFIDSDPIQVPHSFQLKEDQEISGFLTATIAWGNRKMIIRNADRMMDLMGNSPYDFIMESDESHIDKFVHRTFNEIDLKHLYKSRRT